MRDRKGERNEKKDVKPESERADIRERGCLEKQREQSERRDKRSVALVPDTIHKPITNKTARKRRNLPREEFRHKRLFTLVRKQKDTDYLQAFSQLQ